MDEKRWNCTEGEAHWDGDPDTEEGPVQLNEFSLLEVLGRGSYGKVMIAERCVGEQPFRKFAVKVASRHRLRRLAEYVNNGEGMKKVTAEDKMRREIDIMRHLYHRNVVLLFQVLEDEDYLCMVMEYMAGGATMNFDKESQTFCRPSEEQVYTEDRALAMLRNLCDGLQYLHGEGIVHRDIKPDNLMLYDGGTLRIGDFGCAIKINQGDRLKETVGTYSFFAPESVAGDSQGFDPYGVDIWAAGITLYSWLFGGVPFSADGVEPLFEAIRNEPLDLGSSLSLEIQELMAGMLMKDPDERFALPQCLERCQAVGTETK
ncbi:unnamed protein product [Chrysoparadoxa australica]